MSISGRRWAILGMFLGLWPHPAAAQSSHWPLRATIRVWVASTDAPSGSGALVERAMRTWSTASDGRLTLVRTLLRTDADIEVAFVRGSANYGETRPEVDATTGFIRHATVAIAADIPNDTLTRQIVAYLTALHELGHALGLDHTTNMADIMYLFRRPDDGPRYFSAYRSRLRTAADIGGASATGLSPADVKALADLYGDRQ